MILLRGTFANAEFLGVVTFWHVLQLAARLALYSVNTLISRDHCSIEIVPFLS